MDKRYDERGSKTGVKFMSNQVIKLSENAAKRIKEIMADAETSTIGVRTSIVERYTLSLMLIGLKKS